jgi:hypothetical protein
MKTLCCWIALVLAIARLDASSLNLDGDLSWEITEPRCTFTLDGAIQNLSPYTTGTIKLVLFAGRAAFPAREFIAGEKTLGQLNSGAQFSDLSIKTTATIPAVSGDYYFTLAILEYTGAYWQALRTVATGKKSLLNGNFTAQQKWPIPTATVTVPPSTLQPGKILRLSARATEELNLLPAASQEFAKLRVQTRTKVIISNRAEKQALPYTYATTKDKLNQKSVAAGSLSINYAGKEPSASNTKITLYYQTANSGTYKSVEALNSATETTWGSFTFQ